MKYSPLAGAALLVSAFLVLLSACSPGETVKVTYFFASHCNDCEEAGELLKTTKTDFRVDGRPIRLEIELYNILGDQGWDVLMKILSERDVPLSAQHMPLLFVADQWYYGDGDILAAVENLREQRLPQGVTLP